MTTPTSAIESLRDDNYLEQIRGLDFSGRCSSLDRIGPGQTCSIAFFGPNRADHSYGFRPGRSAHQVVALRKKAHFRRWSRRSHILIVNR